MPSIAKKTVWITGASSGIGEALVYQLRKQDCKLIISSRNEADLRRVKNNCDYPRNIKIIPLNLENFSDMPMKTAEAVASFGSIDILINNAGISQRSYILDTDLEVYKKLMDVNYLGTVALTKALLPYFIKQRSGHFVTVTSLMGKFGSPLRSGYCGAKHALHGFFDVLRMEHEKDNIEVTLICPGFIQTNIAKNALTGNGTAQNKEDVATANGMKTDVLSRKIIRAIEKRNYEVYIGGNETFAVLLKRLFPKLLHRVVLKSKVT